MSASPPAEVECTACGKMVEVCDCCEYPECKHVICHDCLSKAVGERRPATYTSPE
jgi:hypothetical protein